VDEGVRQRAAARGQGQGSLKERRRLGEAAQLGEDHPPPPEEPGRVRMVRRQVRVERQRLLELVGRAAEGEQDARPAHHQTVAGVRGEVRPGQVQRRAHRAPRGQLGHRGVLVLPVGERVSRRSSECGRLGGVLPGGGRVGRRLGGV
jgi:hypothetical protein